MQTPSSTHRAGRHFLQIPGPTNVPDRILRAVDFPTIDHRGPEFAKLGKECFEGMKAIFKMTKGHVFIYPASGTGAWEAAIVNTLSPGDRVLMFETGHSSSLTAILMPEGHDEAEFRKVVLDNFNLSLGAGLAKLTGKVFRIGHLGDLNDLMLCGTLCGAEMGLELFGVLFQKGGVAAAMDFLAGGDTARCASHVQRTAASSPKDGGGEKQCTPSLSSPV